MNAIEIKELHKSFGDKEAVKGLNLDIGHHELFGLLGVNGAGKTTTIRMICCLLKPTSDQAASNVERIIKDFILEEIADDKAKTLSGGWQRRLSIAMALVTEPEILFLDEPTLGLDVTLAYAAAALLGAVLIFRKNMRKI